MKDIYESSNNKHHHFNQLFQEYSGKINRMAGRYFTNSSDREDVVQETFIRIYKSMHLLDSEKNTSAWIYRIGINICIDILRRRHTRYILNYTGVADPNDVLEREPSSSRTPELLMMLYEENEKLKKAINQLPQKWRPFIYQRYILEMTLKEISIANQMPINTVKSRIHRALRHLNKVLEKDEFHLLWTNDKSEDPL